VQPTSGSKKGTKNVAKEKSVRQGKTSIKEKYITIKRENRNKKRKKGGQEKEWG